jgi:predicted dehydrogenase
MSTTPAPIRWGILGTGNIAHKFAEGLAVLPDAVLVAVGSRTPETAEAFARRYGVPNVHASYESLAQDPQVDVVYISTPHPLHMDNTLLCLEAGKAVLCEKPFALNAAQAQRMIETARAKGLFLMEAMWTRYHPAARQAYDWIQAGKIGHLHTLHADFGFNAPFNPQGRLFNPELGGGALLDVGIYPISLASWLFGQQPDFIASQAVLGSTGVDERAGVVFRYAGGGLAVLSMALRADTTCTALMVGEAGSLQLERPFWASETLVYRDATGREERLPFPFEREGYHYEAAEVGRCLRAGLLESPTMPLDESLALMHTLDALRADWGLVYPQERG